MHNIPPRHKHLRCLVFLGVHICMQAIGGEVPHSKGHYWQWICKCCQIDDVNILYAGVDILMVCAWS